MPRDGREELVNCRRAGPPESTRFRACLSLLRVPGTLAEDTFNPIDVKTGASYRYDATRPKQPNARALLSAFLPPLSPRLSMCKGDKSATDNGAPCAAAGTPAVPPAFVSK